MKVILGDMLRRRGWSQKELSDRSGVPAPMISQIISGDVKYPRIDTMYKLSCALRCSLYDLIEEERNPSHDRTA